MSAKLMLKEEEDSEAEETTTAEAAARRIRDLMSVRQDRSEGYFLSFFTRRPFLLIVFRALL